MSSHDSYNHVDTQPLMCDVTLRMVYPVSHTCSGIFAWAQVQLFSKVSTPLHVQPLDSMTNVIRGIGYSCGTAWIIDLTHVS